MSDRPCHVAVACPQGADRQHHGVVLVPEPLDGKVYADFAFGDEPRSLGTHLGQSLVERGLLELVLRDAVAHQSTDAVVALVHGDVVAGARELLCRSESGGTRSDDGHPPARGDGRGLGFDDSVHPGLVGDGLLDALDRDAAARLLLADGQHTRGLTRRRAQPSGELREVVGRVQAVARRVPSAAPHQVIPFRDQIAQRAARGSGVAERDSAVHTSTGLLRDLARALVGILLFVDLAPVADTLVDGSLGGFDLGNLEKSCRISHGLPP